MTNEMLGGLDEATDIEGSSLGRVLVLTLDVGMVGMRIRSVGFPLFSRYPSTLLQFVLYLQTSGSSSSFALFCVWFAPSFPQRLNH